MSRMIDADALYEKTAEWEARALAVIEKLNRKPFEEMDANEITEWRKWSCILNERSAFKHDVADAPTVEQQQWIPVTKRLPNREEYIQCNGLFIVSDGNSSYAEYFDIYDKKCFGYPVMHGFRADRAVTAWKPLPEPWKGKGNADNSQI